MKELAGRLGANVRFFRESHGLSLTQVSARSGIAKSTLSQIEAGTTNPTLATLYSLAGAFSIDPQQLVMPAPDELGTILRRVGMGSDISGESTVAELVRSVLVGPSVVEFHRVELSPGTHETSPSHGAGSWEHVVIVEGRMSVGPVDEEVVAGPGDYVSYRGDVPHRFIALDTDRVVYWIVATFPRRLAE